MLNKFIRYYCKLQYVISNIKNCSHMQSEREKQKQRQQANASAVQTEKRKKSKSPKKVKKVIPLPNQKSLLCEVTRLRGQQKLLYIKQAKQKKASDEEFFANYPYCKLDSFTFNIQVLQTGGKIIRDQNGLHWVQQSMAPHHNSKHSHGKNLMNGWAISILNDGKVLQGIYHDSQLCGTGYQLQPNGNTYVGSFKQGTKCGLGTYYWFTSDQMYAGQWLGGLPHGLGKYLNGDYYEGQFCNGMKYGSGQQIFRNGDRYIGQYINGVADGYGEYFWIDGSVYKGDFKLGVRHGYGIWMDHKQTENYSGCYKMDKKEGFGVYQWVGKQCYKGQFREDYREGYGRLYELSSKFTPDSTQQSRVFDEKIIYQGMWQRGKQKSDLPVDKEAAKKLDTFIADNKFNSPKKKKRIGHQNCIPKQI